MDALTKSEKYKTWPPYSSSTCDIELACCLTKTRLLTSWLSLITIPFDRSSNHKWSMFKVQIKWKRCYHFHSHVTKRATFTINSSTRSCLVLIFHGGMSQTTPPPPLLNKEKHEGSFAVDKTHPGALSRFHEKKRGSPVIKRQIHVTLDDQILFHSQPKTHPQTPNPVLDCVSRRYLSTLELGRGRDVLRNLAGDGLLWLRGCLDPHLRLEKELHHGWESFRKEWPRPVSEKEWGDEYDRMMMMMIRLVQIVSAHCCSSQPLEFTVECPWLSLFLMFGGVVTGQF